MQRNQTWPVFDQRQIDAVADVLRSGKVNAWTGPDVRSFEEEFAAHVGTSHAIAMANGSVTLDAALRALKLQPGDEVIVSPRSFVVSASCVLLAGGRPVFADVDPDSQNITPASIVPLINDRTRGIIPVHLAGWPCDMAGTMTLAREHDLWVIEDCAQAHGARIGDQIVGSFGDLGSYSFCQDKIMSTGGEGGMIVTNADALHDRIWSFKDHGKDRALVFERDTQPGFRWLHAAEPGTNLRMTGMSAAIGRVQLQLLPDWHAQRSRNAARLAHTLSQSDALRIPLPPENLTHAWYRFYAFIRPEALTNGWDRDRILAIASMRQIPLFSGSCSEVYREGIFSADGDHPPRPLPVARELGDTSLAFLVDPTWDETQLDELSTVLLEILEQATA
ncbi:DegT/DnrJ/EryC1/StrS family aminotransferase [Paracoccus aerodenitrificans]|uniref:DegT/DnrJ/EryC1/StrS family aminotransferase n=1 Tax=Paracoccus aerodenitrificans TaxID=3017781 RepID=UPI0022EFF68B|nr:DegT/DnrJ/EryC1/StrS aminotransferase family protein [Paracoccus aerodenitrificans]WBU63456.1 DegT/DnrJ/EryC1/StrS aminotransferase family protein [Paracoccus aerodenitrificans]